ncbi:alpha/beta-hydrolase [Trichodelitschia bisporula]|uniref:Carboxypeptidase n=1 Tax=Trichodelitschia bisporula TaxID=703511 RepID=A0A6G1HJ78_9PEZI|nr:alpha/beta-hydrolase [Trichodelitschia bisporula]
MFLRATAALLGLLAGASAGPMETSGLLSDAARLFASGPGMDSRLGLAPAPVEDTANFRFYSELTAPFRVTSLPDIPFPVGELYSGNLPISASDPSRTLFFVFQPRVGEPVDEITIWLNGGPGCSSLEGFFHENGRFVWPDGATASRINEYSWTNATNMLWVEQPVGTGYSTGTPRAKSQDDIAADFLSFFRTFTRTFPSTTTYKIYLTGESYAGRYVPYIGSAFLAAGLPLAGALIYDPTIGAFDITQEQIPAAPFLRANVGPMRLSPSALEDVDKLHQTCGYDKYMDRYLSFPPPGPQPPAARNMRCDVFSRAQRVARQANSCFNVYDVSERCPTPRSTMKGQGAYFARADVKRALHAPPNTKWSLCSTRRVFSGFGGPQREGDLSPDPIAGALPRVVDGTRRVLVANGDYDMIIMSNGTLLALQNMTWGGALGFQERPRARILGEGGKELGVQHQERGLMWSQGYATGHMGPGMNPALSWRHLMWVLGRAETL